MEDDAGFNARVKTSCSARETVDDCRVLTNSYASTSMRCMQTARADRARGGHDCDTVEQRLSVLRARQAVLKQQVDAERLVAARSAQATATEVAQKAWRARLGLTDADPSIEEMRSTLGLSPDAEDETIARQYRRLMQIRKAEKEKADGLQQARTAACEATKASEFAPGTYTGDRTQSFTSQGDALMGTCRVTQWRSLRLVVEESGCAVWTGMWHDEDACTGDAKRNLTKVSVTCIEKGPARVERAASGMALTGTVATRTASGAPTRYHLWKCPNMGNVRTDLATDLRPKGCLALGGDVEPSEERMMQASCAASAFDEDLSQAPMKVDKDGTLHVSLKDRSQLVLHRIDKK
jgi:hypothetical protein